MDTLELAILHSLLSAARNNRPDDAKRITELRDELNVLHERVRQTHERLTTLLAADADVMPLHVQRMLDPRGFEAKHGVSKAKAPATPVKVTGTLATDKTKARAWLRKPVQPAP